MMEKTEIQTAKAATGISKSLTSKNLILEILKPTDIQINGCKPWDIQVHHDGFYTRVLNEGALGLGESYMDKWWDCHQLDVLFDKILSARLDQKVNNPWAFKLKTLLAKLINFQTKGRAKEVAYKHYDLDNNLFMNMLDSRMVYSCAYYKTARTLEEAQTDKLNLICQKLQLKPGMRLLDVGCGWGGLAKFAALNYGVHVLGVTISKQQYEYAKETCRDLPIEIRLQDYRDVNETFDRIVSVGMFEHVGFKNYDTFMQTIHRALTDTGLFLLHTIGNNESSVFANAWITKYIFPNGMLPSISQIGQAAEKLFIMEDCHSFGAYYDHTLMAWHQNFTRQWHNLKNQYDERFYRMWTYYLLSCAGSFRARSIQLWQLVYSKYGIRGGYNSVR